MRKDIALIVMCIGILLFGCSNQENPSDDKLLENEKVETTAPVTETAEPTAAPADETAAPVETEVPTTEPTVVPTTEPTIVPTVEPTVEPTKQPTKAPVVTKTPTKAPVVTKTPTKKPVVTKAPTKAPATKKPVTTKNPNAAGEPYKVGHVTVTPVKDVTMWSKNQGYIRTKPWTTNTLESGDYDFDWKDVNDKHSVILGWQYYSEIKVTGMCSNGFVQYWMNDGTYKGYVYTHKDQLFTEKPKEFTFKGYDPAEDIIKPALKKLKKNGFTTKIDMKEESIQISKDIIADYEDKLKSIEEGTFNFAKALGKNRWTKEEEEEYKKQIENDLNVAKEDLAEIEPYYAKLEKHEPITENDVRQMSYETLTLNKNINRVDVHPYIITAGVETTQDMVDLIVEQYEFNRDNDTGRSEYVWIFYREIENNGETYYRFYLSGV